MKRKRGRRRWAIEREIERERESYVNSLTVCIHFSIYILWMARREQVTVFLKQWSPMWCFVSAATANTILHIYTKCLASMLIIDDRTRVSDLLECTHTIRSTLILCTAVRTKSLNKNLTLNLVTGNNKLIPKIDSNLRYIDHSAPNRNTQWCYMYISSMNHCLEKNSKIELHTWALVLFDFDIDVDSIWRCAHDMTLPSKKSVCMSN